MDNNFSQNDQNDDFSLEERFKPIELDESKMMKNLQSMQRSQSSQHDSLAGSESRLKTLKIAVIVMAAALAIDMFLPYLTIEVMGVRETTCLFPGLYSLALIGLAAAIVVFMYMDKEKYMLGGAGLVVAVLVRMMTRAGLANIVVKTAGNLVSTKYGIGYYGLLISVAGLVLSVLAYTMSTGFKAPRS